MDVVVRDLSSRKPEITDLQVAILVKQQVTGFEISMEDAGTMDIFKPSKQLVEEVFVMFFGEASSFLTL